VSVSWLLSFVVKLRHEARKICLICTQHKLAKVQCPRQWHFVRPFISWVAFCPGVFFPCGILSGRSFPAVAFCPGLFFFCGSLFLGPWRFVRTPFYPRTRRVADIDAPVSVRIAANDLRASRCAGRPSYAIVRIESRDACCVSDGGHPSLSLGGRSCRFCRPTRSLCGHPIGRNTCLLRQDVRRLSGQLIAVNVLQHNEQPMFRFFSLKGQRSRSQDVRSR